VQEENAVSVSMKRTGALLEGAAAIGGAAWILTRRSA
jgi:hypothetical protein